MRCNQSDCQSAAKSGSLGLCFEGGLPAFWHVAAATTERRAPQRKIFFGPLRLRGLGLGELAEFLSDLEMEKHKEALTAIRPPGAIKRPDKNSGPTGRVMLAVERACRSRGWAQGRNLSACGAKSLSSCTCLLYTSPSPRDGLLSRMPSSA